MSKTLFIQAYSSKESKEFQKHYNAVKFCLENDLSFPKETSEFFKGKIGGHDLEEIHRSAILKNIKNGVEIDMKCEAISYSEFHIKVSDIPKEADLIVVRLT